MVNGCAHDYVEMARTDNKIIYGCTKCGQVYEVERREKGITKVS